MEFKGEIQWPSTNSRHGANIAGTSSHEIAISHDAMRVYSGLGFAIAYLDNLNDPSTWRVYNHTCAIGRQAGWPLHAGLPGTPTHCDVAPQGDWPPQYSHSSDDNLEGTRWYGANQAGTGAPGLDESPATARVVDISQRGNPRVLDSLLQFPGHGLDWWRSPDGREFIVGSNELGVGDTCQPHPRPTSLRNAADAYVAEVTGDNLVHASRVSLMINEPQNCMASGSKPSISEQSVYNKHGAAMLMMEFGGAGLRVFDVRNGYAPKEVAYFNRGGHVHSGRFHYDDKRGIMLQPASSGMRVLVLQPQVITAARPARAHRPGLPPLPERTAGHALKSARSGTDREATMKSRTNIWAGVAVLLATGMAPAVSAQLPDPNRSPALCGSLDTPETGIQGDVPGAGGRNCGLTFLSQLPSALSGAVQGAGHCAYVRNSTGAYGSNGVMKAYSLADPTNPVLTDEEPLYGGSESFRTQVAGGRAILVSGRGVYDITNCEEMEFKGEIQWPSAASRNGAQITGTSSHEIAISHGAMRVYSGLGFAIAYLDNLDDPSTWRVYNHTCAIGRQMGSTLHMGPRARRRCATSRLKGTTRPRCPIRPTTTWRARGGTARTRPGDDNPTSEPSNGYGSSISRSGASRWSSTRLPTSRAKHGLVAEPRRARVHRGRKRARHGRHLPTSPPADELDERRRRLRGRGHRRRSDACGAGEPDDQRAAELHGQAASGSSAAISEHSIYNQHGAALLMMEWGGAGLRVFDVRNGYAPKEVAVL